MPLRPRAGFSLVEVLVALVVGGVLLSLTFELVEQVLWIQRSRGERAGLAAGLRAGATLVGRELEGLGRDSVGGADLLAVGPGQARFRAQRGLWRVCLVRPDSLVVDADSALRWSARLPAAGRDSLLLYLPGDSSAAWNAWLPLPVLASPAPALCPGGGPGLLLLTALDSAALAGYRVPPATVARQFETVELRSYRSSGQWVLGLELRSAGASIQPFLGPLRAGGFDVVPLDSAGVGTGPGAAVGAAFRLVGASDRGLAVGLGARSPAAADSLVGQTPLRNAP
jgi:prepilin-type N-terminal cleavage/methylation domain-containing protein